MNSCEYSRDYCPAAPVIEVALSAGRAPAPAVTIVALLDSGADATLIPRDLLSQIQAPYVQTRRMRGVTGTVVDVDIFAVRLQINGTEVAGIRAIQSRQGTEVILGRDFLNPFIITLNGPALTCELR